MINTEEMLALGDWYHNIVLPGGVRTIPLNKPEHEVPQGHEFPSQMWSHVVPHLGDLTGKTVLDIGCNAGYMTIECIRRGAKVTGIECVEQYCKQSKFALSALGMEAEIIQGDFLGSVLDERQFDVVLAMGVIYHTWHPVKFLENIRGWTKEQVVIESYVNDSTGNVIDLYGAQNVRPWTCRPSLGAVRVMMEHVGLQIVAEDPWAPTRHIFIAK